MNNLTVAVAGGGAAGFFGAIACARSRPDAHVVILEKSPAPLAKVEISGGGRCNVTHACFDPRALAGRYPRGGRELIGAFHRWQPRDTAAWFAEQGVELKTEADGRMFPRTDDSRTITTCLIRAAGAAGVRMRTSCGIAGAGRLPAGGFRLALTDGGTMDCDRLLLATGGNLNSAGHDIAAALGHRIEPLVPSLFTFNIRDERLADLPGISVPDALVAAPGTKLSQSGPVLVTHWGLSGPAVLKLSAWGARAFAERDYAFDLSVNWLPSLDRETLIARLGKIRAESPAKQAGTFPPIPLPGRLWRALLAGAGIDPACRWTAVSNRALGSIAAAVQDARFHVAGRSLFKDEFVTCGGVSLREVDFRTMESKICPGLFLAGELLDIDGLTGGFNLQAAWTTGRIAGLAMAGGGATPGDVGE